MVLINVPWGEGLGGVRNEEGGGGRETANELYHQRLRY